MIFFFFGNLERENVKPSFFVIDVIASSHRLFFAFRS